MDNWPHIQITAHEYRIGEVRATLTDRQAHSLVGTARDAFDPVCSAQAIEGLATELERAATALRERAKVIRTEHATAKAEFDAMRRAGNETPQP